MSIQNFNLHYLDKLMSHNSIDYDVQNFPVSVFFNMITMDQAEKIIKRSHSLYASMESLEKRISELYGKEQTVRLMENFTDIISYSDNILSHESGDTFDEYFMKLESFCGQIENIIKMIRYYYALFETNL